MVTLAEQGVFTPYELLTSSLKAREQNRIAREEIAAKERMQAAANAADMAKARIAANVSMAGVAADREKALSQDRLRQRLSELQTTSNLESTMTPQLTPFEQQQQQIQQDLASMYQQRRKAGMSPLDAMSGLRFGPTGFSVAGDTELDLAREERMRQALALKEAQGTESQALEQAKEKRRLFETEQKFNPEAISEREQSKAISKEVGKDFATVARTKFERASTFEDLLPKLTETYEAVSSGEGTTGLLATFRKDIDRGLLTAASIFGIDPSTDSDWLKKVQNRVSTTEGMETLMGMEVFPQIKALGIGARGLDTPSERQFLQSVLTGTISLNAETLKDMLARRMETAYKEINEYNKDIANTDSAIGYMAKRAPQLYGRTLQAKTHFADFGDSEHAAYLDRVFKTQRPQRPK